MDVNDLIKLLKNMQRNGQDFFIEAEAKISRMQRFITEYNLKYSPIISMSTEGIIEMAETKNKWGLELRLYINDCPNDIKRAFNFTTHTPFRPEYGYRMDDNKVVYELFEHGFRIGLN